MLWRFLKFYIDVCNNIVTKPANSVLMFEAGEQVAMDINTSRLEDIYKDFEKDGIIVSMEETDKKVLFYVEGLPLGCEYCDIFRGFFGGLARKHIDPRYYCRKADHGIDGRNEYVFIAELID